MTVVAYYSSDTSAPTLLEAAQGSMINLLNTLLVGSGGVAYGSKASAGWTLAYTGAVSLASSHQGAFQQGSGSNGFYLSIDDSAASANGSGAKVQMFETMSAWNVGTNGTPTTAQLNPGYFPRGNNGTDTNAMRWCVIADAKRFYMWHEGSSTSGLIGEGCAFGFGDIDTFSAADGYATMLHCYTTAAAAGAGGLGLLSSTLAGTVSGCYIMRRYDQLSSGQLVGKHSDFIKNGQSQIMGNAAAGTGLPYPNPVDGGIYFAPVWAQEAIVGAAPAIRGTIPGIWCPCHTLAAAAPPLQAFDTTSGSGLLAGKSFAFFPVSPNGNNGFIAFETSNTWT